MRYLLQNMQEEIQRLEKEIQAIQERNRKVDADKAWETSRFRILSVALVTYIIAAIVLYLIGANNFLLSALVPTVGYLLSVQTLPVIKRWWIKNHITK